MRKNSRLISAVIVCSLLLLQTAGLFLADTARALNGFIDPNGDGATGNWVATGGGTFYTKIDDAVRQPTAPTVPGDNITANAQTGGSIFQRMSSISPVTSVSQVQVWIYHNDGSNGQINVQLYDDNESTTRSSESALTQTTTAAWHSVTFSSLNLTQSQLDTLSIRMRASKNGGGAAATITVYEMYADVTYSNTPPAFNQSGYRFFNSVNSADVGTVLAGQNTSAALNASGDKFRLRMLVHVTGADLTQNSGSFKLQYVGRGSGTCASPSGGTPSTYTDVTGATLIAYNNLTGGVNDGDALTSNANDPSHSSDTIRNQNVEEANNFSNTRSTIAIGEDGKWDFALVDNGAPGGTTYCFKAVESGGSDFGAYTHYPQITTGNGTLSVDIVDSGGSPVASPAFSMTSSGYLFTCDPTTTTVGTSSQRIQVTNNTGTAAWNLSIAATSGATANWNSGGNTYDFNDPSGSPAGCSDGGDADSIAGQLTLNASVGTSTPQSGCTNTGISLGASSAFNQGTTDSITLLSASSSASVGCYWQLTGVSGTQQIPQDQPAGSYSINLTLTVVSA